MVDNLHGLSLSFCEKVEETEAVVAAMLEEGTSDSVEGTDVLGLTDEAISHSKLSCNSNIALVTPGPLSQYQFKYELKNTQDMDAAEFHESLKSIKAMQGRVHAIDRIEAVRVMSRCAFAPMAAYLIRNWTRFYFPLELVFCPVNDLISLLEGVQHIDDAVYSEMEEFDESFQISDVRNDNLPCTRI